MCRCRTTALASRLGAIEVKVTGHEKFRMEESDEGE